MMGRFALVLGFGFLVAALGEYTAAADQPRVLVLAGGEPPCVRAAELAAALGRHGQLATVVHVVPEASEVALVGVRVSAAGLEVRLLGPSGLDERVIPTPPCEVAVEVVAAWVASVLDGSPVEAAPAATPAPSAPPAAPGPETSPPPVDLRAAVLSELSWVGLDLDQRGYSLGLTGKAGNWRVTLGRGPCTHQRLVGGVPTHQEAAVTRLVAAVASMLGDPESCLHSELTVAQRRRLGRAMAPPLREGGGVGGMEGAFSITLGLLSLAGAAADEHVGDDHEHLFELGGGLAIAGGVVGWAFDDRRFAQPMLDTLMWTGAGFTALGLEWDAPAVAFFAQGLIELGESLGNPAPPSARLRAHRRRVTGASAPSRAELVAAERDLRWSHSTLYRIFTMANFVTAAAATASMEFEADLPLEERRDRRSGATTRAVMLGCIGALLIIQPTRWSRYQDHAGGVSASVGVTAIAGGAALSARGRF